MNIFTKDLESLFRNQPTDTAIRDLENEFTAKKSVRAASLLTWYYLLGSYEDPVSTKNWTKSFFYLKEILKLEKKDNEMTRGSSHNSFMLFLLQQSVLIKNFTYFDHPFVSQYKKNPNKIKHIVKAILEDTSSQTNSAL